MASERQTSACITTSYHKGVNYDNQLIKVKSATNSGYEEATSGDTINLVQPNSKTRRGRVGKQKAQTLETSCNQAVVENCRIRRLTPIECERLQGFPDDHTAFGNYDGVVKPMSNTQRYKQCGNAVTVDVVAAVAKKCMPLINKNQSK
jgi:DNA (cytosine-5)-methyltransferase 1